MGELSFMTDITKLKGIGDVIAKKFEKNGITSVEQLFVIPPPKVAEMLGVDNPTAMELFRKARALMNDTPMFKSGLEAKVEDDGIERITTGTNALDKLFGGGLETGATTEVYGEFGCGKTQFCHTMATRVQLPKDQGGLEGKAVWLDSEGTFEPTRIEAIAEALEMDTEKALDGIIHAPAYNSADQYMILQEIEHLIENDKDIKLIVIDSAIGLFRQDYSGRGMLSERQKYLDEFLTLGSNIANFHKVAIIWTNQVMINPGVFYGDPVTAVGGTVLAHKSTYRVYFKKSGAYRIAIMKDSPKHGQIEVMFGLSSAGVVDREVAEELEKERKKAKAASKKAEKKEDEDEA
jgi:DNA repair protein RadA